MYGFIKTYENPNKFNEEIITGLRKKDDMVDYLVDVCKALETIPHIKFDGYEVIRDENKFKQKNWIPINDSRLSLVNFRFTINFKGEVEKVSMPIFIPKLINNYYFVLNGNKYYAIYQNVDASTYNTKDSVILKSLLMPIIVKAEGKKNTDQAGKEYDSNIFLINLFKHKANILHYYFSELGYDPTLEYFGFKKYISLVKRDKDESDTAIYFAVNKNVSMRVVKKKFEKDKFFRSFVFCILDMFNKKTQIDKRNDTDYWKTKLGSIFTKNANNQLEKAETVLLSFRRILDDRTRKNLRIDEQDKSDIFALIRWMTSNFAKLMKKDNLALENKRLRLAEYQITSFNRKMSSNTYRILNSKTMSMNKLKGIFKISPMTIISDLQTSELMRYNNAVNDMDLFTVALKFSNRGPSAIGEGSKKTVSIMYRGIHESHLGRLSLNSTSAGDPGMSGHLSPFIETDDFYYDISELEDVDE
jgi:hypothetical protein